MSLTCLVPHGLQTARVCGPLCSTCTCVLPPLLNLHVCVAPSAVQCAFRSMRARRMVQALVNSLYRKAFDESTGMVYVHPGAALKSTAPRVV